MAFLARTAIKSEWLGDDVDGDCFNQASYDLRLGAEAYIVGEDTPKLLTPDDPYLVLKPGHFAMLTTVEKLNMPDDHMAFITVRMRYKNQGLVNISGFHVDPSFSGHLKFAVQNVGPSDVYLRLNEPTFSIFFALVHGQIGERRKPVARALAMDDMHTLGGSSVTLTQMKKDIDRLNQLLMIYAPFAVSAFIAILVLIYKVLMGKG